MIGTKRLRLEPLRASHAEDMIQGLTDEKLYRYIPEDPPISQAALADRYRKLESGRSPDGKDLWLNWIIRRQSNNEAIGYVQVTVQEKGPSQIAYLVFSQHWGRGFASEAVAAILNKVFECHKTQEFEALVDTRNISSQNLLASLGFKRVETIENADFFKGSSSDEFRYVIRRSSTKNC